MRSWRARLAVRMIRAARPLSVAGCALLLLPTLTPRGPAAETLSSPIDPQQAAAWFREMAELSKADGGRLWGTKFYGPMFFVDPSTRAVAANQADPERRLVKSGKLWTGMLPVEMAIANTAVDWAGVRWTMMMWPLPEDPTSRKVLMAHESWHRIQDSLGLPLGGLPSFHLDTLEGRYWLQLEWRALRAALEAAGEARRTAVEAALLFRAHRRAIAGDDAAANENALEKNEGLAEYSGVRLALPEAAAARAYAADQLERFSRKAAFARSFAYASGPAYGLLLDEASPTWRGSARYAKDLGELLRASMGLLPVTDDADRAAQLASTYDRDGSLRQAELAREEKRLQRLADYERRFVEGPIVHIALESSSFSFDPNQVYPFGDRGTVYGVLSIHGAWGSLEAKEGALVSADHKGLVLEAPANSASTAASITGPGWTLTLDPGWQLVPGPRPGDLEVVEVR